MSILKRRWHIHQKDENLTQEISREFKISDITSQVLVNRGIKEKKEISAFLNPRLSSLRDPFEIPDMKEAISRVLLARQRGEKVLIYGDYDVDGVTATAILVLALKKIGLDVSYYIPHRYGEGYGMNEDAVREIASNNVRLIITVDCGISNFEEIDLASKLGVDVIVTDHHNIPSELPRAFAIVNPKFIKEPHPSKNLSGAGVAFKFIWALFRSSGISDSASIREFLDLAALGTVADVVPLNGENRTIVVSGIKVINEKKRLGVKQLVNSAGISGEITPHKISFMLAPRLNAPGRLDHANLSMKLLLESDSSKAQGIAAKINEINLERQQIGNLIGEEVFSRMENVEEKKLIILSGKLWHQGVIGIVASKMAERFNRPAILISEDENGSCRGSARGIENFDVYALLESCKDLFSDFGGHKAAAGFEMPSTNLPALEERLSKEIDGCLTIDNLVPKTKIDAELSLDKISIDFANELATLEPFGNGNPEPILMSQNLKVVSAKKVGSEGNHLKVKFSGGGAVFDAIGFGMGEFFAELKSASAFDVAYNLSLNKWDGFEFPQMGIVDMRKAL